jgi:hypothetical protein
MPLKKIAGKKLNTLHFQFGKLQLDRLLPTFDIFRLLPDLLERVCGDGLRAGLCAAVGGQPAGAGVAQSPRLPHHDSRPGLALRTLHAAPLLPPLPPSHRTQHLGRLQEVLKETVRTDPHSVWRGSDQTQCCGSGSKLGRGQPEMEFLDMNLTKGPSLLLHAIHSLFY